MSFLIHSNIKNIQLKQIQQNTHQMSTVAVPTKKYKKKNNNPVNTPDCYTKKNRLSLECDYVLGVFAWSGQKGQDTTHKDKHIHQ